MSFFLNLDEHYIFVNCLILPLRPLNDGQEFVAYFSYSHTVTVESMLLDAF